MTTPAQRETILRKPILMPSSMIAKVDKIAKERKVSVAEVVREAVDVTIIPSDISKAKHDLFTSDRQFTRAEKLLVPQFG